MTYRHLTVDGATPRIGAYLSGVDLNTVEDPEAYAEIRRAVHEFGVVFFRRQPMTPAAFVRLGGHFGRLETAHPVFGSPPEHPEVQIIKFDPSKPVETQAWHTDNTYNDCPTAYTFLRAIDIPPSGGDTLWASTSAILEDLPKPLREALATLSARNDLFWRIREMDYLNRTGQKGAEGKYLDRYADHPIVIRHPVTGKAQLFVNRLHTCTIHGVPDHVSDALIHFLFGLVKQPDYQVRLRWEPDTVAIWDNLATQHYATMDYAPYPRAMMRMVATKDERPKPIYEDRMIDRHRPWEQPVVAVA